MLFFGWFVEFLDVIDVQDEFEVRLLGFGIVFKCGFLKKGCGCYVEGVVCEQFWDVCVCLFEDFEELQCFVQVDFVVMVKDEFDGVFVEYELFKCGWGSVDYVDLFLCVWDFVCEDVCV